MVTSTAATIVGKVGTYRSNIDVWISVDKVAKVLISSEDDRQVYLGVHPDADDTFINLLEEFMAQNDACGTTVGEFGARLVTFLREKGL